jgi:hypothetical protein
MPCRGCAGLRSQGTTRSFTRAAFGASPTISLIYAPYLKEKRRNG